MNKLPAGLGLDFEPYCDYCPAFEANVEERNDSCQLQQRIITCSHIKCCRIISEHIDVAKRFEEVKT